MLLKTKLFLLAIVCALLPLSLSTFWAARVASEAIEQELIQKSRDVLEQTNLFTKTKIESIFSYTFLAVSNPALPLAIEKLNWKLLNHVSGSMEKGLKLDILEIIDGTGHLLYSKEDTAGVAAGRTSSIIAQKLLSRQGSRGSEVSMVGLENRKRGVAIVVATMLPKISMSRSSVMLMGFYFDADFFGEIGGVQKADFCLLSGGQVVASTLKEKNEDVAQFLSANVARENWEKVKGNVGFTQKVKWRGASHILGIQALEVGDGNLQLAVFLPSEKAEQARRRSMLLVGGAGLIGIFVALAMARVLSARLMTPIQKLTQAAEQLGKGNVSAQVDVTSKDEIGFLAYTFNTMVTELKAAQEKLVLSERFAAIGQMAAGVGHELRNPLAAIKNAIYFIKGQIDKSPKNKENESILSMIAVAENEIKTTIHISNDLLELSRASKMTPLATDLNNVIRGAVDIISVPQGIVYEKKYAETLPVIYIDPERMRQVFINLVNNALEAMTKGGTLQIETRAFDDHVDAYIRDTGSGIKEEDVEKIFQPLFTTKVKGTGLGLAIVNKIVETHGGRITVKSVVGVGTEFTVRLPRQNPQ